MNIKTVEIFLLELSQLTKKYGIRIDGCGCCGSPFLEEVDEELSAKECIYCVDTRVEKHGPNAGHRSWEHLEYESLDSAKDDAERFNDEEDINALNRFIPGITEY